MPNPARTRLRRKLLRVRQQLTELEAAYRQAVQGNQEAQRPTMRGFKIANADLGQQLLAAYLGANRSVVSGESDQSFRSNPITLRGGGGAVA